MGTTTVYGTSHLTPLEFIKSQIERQDIKIIDHSIKGNVAYLALLIVPTGEVFAVVCLLHKDSDARGYRLIEETMGPCECDCPKRILDNLSPTECEYANRWRARCRERASKKSKRPSVGQTLRFAKPLRFSDGSQESEFKVVKAFHRGRNITAYQGKNGRTYRITRITNQEFEVA